MMRSVLQRPMFRRNGSPSTGERISNLQTLLQDIRDTERLRSTVGDAESDNVQRQLGNLLRVPFEEFQGKYVKNPKTGEFEPMSGPLTGTVLREGEMMMDPNSVVREGEVEMVTVIDRREGSETFGMPISVPRNMDTYEMIRSGMFEFDEIAGMADGGEMKSDAVGIADGLDQETPKADPNTEGVAKVSPAQYVELMNQVRGDEVPLEGRVQELATTVGEKDAQDTPLSVLALVQPVFELQEQQGGLAAAPGAQQMMQQQNPMMMKDGGIVYRETGTDQGGENAFSSLAAAGFDQNMLDAVQLFGKEYFGVGSEFDTEAARRQYEQMLMNKSQMRDQAYLDAAPLLLQLGATALNPEASLSDVFTVGASNLARFGTNIGKQTKALQDQALKLALADKAKEDQKESAYMSAIAPKLLETAFKDPQTVALQALDITSKTLDNLEKEAKLGVLDETLQTELATNIATLEKMKTENKYLGTTLQLDIETKLEQLYGIQYDNQNKILQNEFQTITNQFAADKENASLQGQLLDNINQQLNNVNLGIQNEYLPTEKDLGIEQLNANIDQVLATTSGQMITNDMNQIELENLNSKLFLEAMEKKLQIEKLQDEIDNPKKDFEQIKVEDSFRKEFKGLKVVKDTESRYDSYRKMRIAIDASNDPDAGGAGDVTLVFEFMKMLDPNSTVREGEYATAKNTGGLPDDVVNTYNALLSGQFLNNKQRTEFLNIAEGIFQSQLSQYNTEYNTYAGIAERNFGADNVKNVLPLPSFDLDYLDDILSEDTITNFLKTYDNNLLTDDKKK
jgi:hypothetical protein